MYFINRYAPLWLTIGLVLWLESLVTIEWAYPYCLSQADGPAYAPQGMPLPYWMWNGVVSLEHQFMPHVYILNVIILCLLVFPIIRWIFNRVISKRPKWLTSVIGGIGILMLVSHIALTILMVSTGYYRPEKVLGLDGYFHYSEFRPVRFGFTASSGRGCVPSRFWFPDGWRHD